MLKYQRHDDYVFSMLMRILLVLVLILLLLPIAVYARDDGQWSNQKPEIRAWFRSVMVPPANVYSCCGEADAFDAEMDGENPNGDMRVIVLNGRGVLPDGTLVIVPRTVLQTRYGNPLDKIILFLGSSNQPICLIPKVGA